MGNSEHTTATRLLIYAGAECTVSVVAVSFVRIEYQKIHVGTHPSIEVLAYAQIVG